MRMSKNKGFVIFVALGLQAYYILSLTVQNPSRSNSRIRIRRIPNIPSREERPFVKTEQRIVIGVGPTKDPLAEARENATMILFETRAKRWILPGVNTTIREPSAENMCKELGAENFLLVMIISRPENKDARTTFRGMMRSWKDVAVPDYPAGSAVKALFFIGVSNNTTETIRESDHYGDIVIDDFHESYVNLSLKIMRMLKWTQQNCPRTPFLGKVDDDVWLNLPPLLRNLVSLKDPKGRSTLMAGFVIYGGLPIRYPKSKWFLPKEIWTFSTLPTYLGGPFYVLGSRAREELLLASISGKEGIIYLEDLYLTGYLREKVGVAGSGFNLTSWNDQTSKNWESLSWFPCQVIIKSVISIHLQGKWKPLMSCFAKMKEYCNYKRFAPVKKLCNSSLPIVFHHKI